MAELPPYSCSRGVCRLPHGLCGTVHRELHFVVGRGTTGGSFRAVESGADPEATDLQDSRT
jgi:hypothetical protein